MGDLRSAVPVPPPPLDPAASMQPPINRSRPAAAALDEKPRNDAPQAISTARPPALDHARRNPTTDAVSELLQRALSLKEGELDEAREGQRTPGEPHHPVRIVSDRLIAAADWGDPPSSARLADGSDRRLQGSGNSTDHTAVDAVDEEASSRPSASRNNSLISSNTDPSPPLARMRSSASNNSRRPPSRPHGASSRHSQQRITPPHSWNASSPSSSSDGVGYPLPFHAPPTHAYHSSQSYGASNAYSTGGPAGYGYQASPPFLGPQHRHPSQLSDQSAGWSTGSPYSVTSSNGSMWYQHYSSAVTTPSGYPTPNEGTYIHAQDVSPENMSDVSSSRGPSQAYPFEQPPPPLAYAYPQNQAYAEQPQPSQQGPYQPVYFAAPQRMAFASPPTGQNLPQHAFAAEPPVSYPAAQMQYPISSSHPQPPMGQHDAGYTIRGEYPIRSGSTWSQGPPPPAPPPPNPTTAHHVPYGAYPSPTNTYPIDPRGYPQRQSHTQYVEAPAVNYGRYPMQQPVSAPRLDHPPPPVIPPRPSVSTVYSPVAGASPLPVAPPKIYVPPPEISRGVLASTRLREAVQSTQTVRPVRATRNDRDGANGTRKGNLPKPPTHSPHALWVGNVPSDASHSELWQFFVSRPPPSAVGLLTKDDLDLQTPGVESIHLIARSNCAFVNYVSDLHLQHAINVSTGISLRPNDPRCKTLVCRVRKQEDESKTGVGAQRVGGMHRAFVKMQQERMNESADALRTKLEEEGAEPKTSATKAFEARRHSSSSLSIGTTSTTSSFLSKHFERRWFIMKSHDEADLKLSVESGLWATQPHNEPVLQQAFRTAKEVFLVFSANGSGEWFGYARMTGPIASVSSNSRPSWSSSGQASAEETASSASLSAPSQTIPEEEPSTFPPRPPVLFSPSEHRLAQASPSNITPSPAPSRSQQSEQKHGGSYPMRLPSEIEAEARHEMAIEQERMAFVTRTNLHLPPNVAEAAKRAVTYDSAAAGSAKRGNAEKDEVPPGTLRDAIRQLNADKPAVARDDDEETRRPARSGSSSTWGTPFTVDWIKVCRLPFARTRHIRNSFNGNREVKVSRDGTEVEPAAGQALLDEFARAPEATLDVPRPRAHSTSKPPQPSQP
ncbi:hypothetical protein JCM10212_003893 [Sporobolomyces blumeae]